MKKKKIIRISIIAVVALLILGAIGKKSGCIGKKEVVQVATEQVSPRTIIETVSASGKIQPEVAVKISPDVSGEVVELYVKEGDKVLKGDVLAKIKPDIYESNYEQMQAALNAQRANEANAKARLAQVKAQFINARLSYERSEVLWKQKAISQAEYDQVKSAFDVSREEVSAAEEAYKAAQFNVKSTEATVKEAKENLSKTVILAPVDGTISKLNIEKGERVVGTTQFAGTEIMTIANLNEMEVNVSVNENDIVKVSLGDTALVEVDAYLNRKFKGIVTEIANSAEVTGISADQVTNFNVKIRILRESYQDLLNPDKPNLSPFRPGMSASVDIQTETRSNVMSVPIQCVVVKEDTSSKDPAEKMAEKVTEKPGTAGTAGKTKNKQEAPDEYVFVYNNGMAIMTKVQTGIQDNMYIEVVSGLTDKQEVISAPYSAITKKLKNKSRVEKVDKKELYLDMK